MVPDRPASRAEASRFLAQATFGPTSTEIDGLMQSDYLAWIDDQLAKPATFHQPVLGPNEPFGSITHEDRRRVWSRLVIGAEDQLRQRVAFALSEIFVVSDRNDELEDRPVLVVDFYDTLVRGAFGSYRDLLEQVTLQPAMGMYLSMVKNRAPEPMSNLRPDENYAREVMQLFSIGLFELNADGTPRLDAQNQRIPTYDQEVIVGMAHALTGWNFLGADPTTLVSWLDTDPQRGAMTPAERFHDVQPKLLVGRVMEPGMRDARTDLGRTLDLLAAHPNVGPFLGKQLIQRLVTSNPSNDYVARVAAVWDDDGAGARGHLGAVVRAILLDPEARGLNPAVAATFGKLREPLLKAIAVTRAYATPGAELIFEQSEQFAQAPLSAPSVFNFFRPDYATPSLRQEGLVAPELQIVTQTFIQRTANAFGFGLIDEYLELPIELDGLAAIAGTPEALVDELDVLLCGGRLVAESRAAILEHLSNVPLTGSMGPEGFERAREALHLIAVSPDFAVQR